VITPAAALVEALRLGGDLVCATRSSAQRSGLEPQAV